MDVNLAIGICGQNGLYSDGAYIRSIFRRAWPTLVYPSSSTVRPYDYGLSQVRSLVLYRSNFRNRE